MPLSIIREDITRMKVDAIVTAGSAREGTPRPTGGVNGKIHQRAGEMLLTALRKLGGVRTGGVTLTKAYDLPCKYVIHTAGPKWQGGRYGEAALLESCYREALKLAVRQNFESIAFPLISTGKYGYPKQEAFQVATTTIRNFLNENDIFVYLVVYDEESFRISGELFEHVEQFINQHYIDEQHVLSSRAAHNKGDNNSHRCRRCFAPISPEYRFCLNCGTATPRERISPERILQDTRIEKYPPFPVCESISARRILSRRSAPRESDFESTNLQVKCPRCNALVEYPHGFCVQCGSPVSNEPIPNCWSEEREEQERQKQIAKYNRMLSEYCPAEDTQKKDDAVIPDKSIPTDLQALLNRLDEGFVEMLLRKIDEKGMTDSACYRRANVDRKLFSKIRNTPKYTPKKPTVVAFCFALELSLSETRDMLSKAGYSMSRSNVFDVVVEYFISHKLYDIDRVNQVLFDFDMPLLGSESR